MYSVIRRYDGVPALIEGLERRQDDVRREMSATPGFVAYYAIRDGKALTTVTVAQSRAEAEESSRSVAKWLKENLPDVKVRPPDVSGGEVFIHTP